MGLVTTPLLALTIWLGWSLGSPLFTNTTVDEEFPFAFTAQVPDNMEREEVELIMSGMAQVDMPVNEAMPTMTDTPLQLVAQTTATEAEAPATPPPADSNATSGRDSAAKLSGPANTPVPT